MKSSTSPFCITRLLTALLLGLSTACSVYVPMLAPTPLITEKGKAEVGASLRLPTQLEVYGAYSPVKHVLVFADGAHFWGIPANGASLSSTQGEAGVGGYTAFGGDRWYVGGLAGYGANTFHSRLYNPPSTPLKEYRTRYSRTFGQLYLSWHHNSFGLGASYRISGVNYRSLTRNDVPVNDKTASLFGNAMLFMRAGSGPLQLQLQAGTSSPIPGAGGRETDVYSSEPVLGVGVVLRPHLLGNRAGTP